MLTIAKGYSTITPAMRLPKQISEFFRKQGKIGAAKRHASMSAERRREIAQTAAKARWVKPDRCPEFLHEAMRIVLLDEPRHTCTAARLSSEIAKRGLYVKRDGSRADSHQVAVRARKYPGLFDIESGNIQLRATARSNRSGNGGTK